MDNQSKNLFGNSFIEKNLLSPGSYLLTLAEVKEGQARQFDKDQEPRPSLIFKFTTESGVTVTRTVTATTSTRGRCLEFVRQMAGANQPTAKDLKSGEAFSEFILNLVGGKFQASIQTSSNGRYNDIVSIRQVEE